MNTVTYEQPPKNLPIVPNDILARFFVDGLDDSRFAGCARLLQSVWRDRHQLEIGQHKEASGTTRRLGSRLSPNVARSGANFLAPDIAKIVRREVAYREIGALIEEKRLRENLLSSQTLTFNLFARAKADREYATLLFSTLFPDLIQSVNWIAFEHSPGRGNPAFLGDYTAFDLFVLGTANDGTPAFLAIEVKYSEAMKPSNRIRNPSYRELTREFALHVNPDEPGLLTEPLAQLTAEHLLASVIQRQLGGETRGAFVTVAPRENNDAWNALALYGKQLTSGSGGLGFVALTLEDVVEAIGEIGDTVLAQRLNERYIDFTPVHCLIDEWEPAISE